VACTQEPALGGPFGWDSGTDRQLQDGRWKALPWHLSLVLIFMAAPSWGGAEAGSSSHSGALVEVAFSLVHLPPGSGQGKGLCAASLLQPYCLWAHVILWTGLW
jgi:hypothetical protein